MICCDSIKVHNCCSDADRIVFKIKLLPIKVDETPLTVSDAATTSAALSIDNCLGNSRLSNVYDERDIPSVLWKKTFWLKYTTITSGSSPIDTYSGFLKKI